MLLNFELLRFPNGGHYLIYFSIDELIHKKQGQYFSR